MFSYSLQACLLEGEFQLLPLDVGVTERNSVVRGDGLCEQLDSPTFKPPDLENLLRASVEVFGGVYSNPCDFLLA